MSDGAKTTIDKAAYQQAFRDLEDAIRTNDRAKGERAQHAISTFAPFLMARVEELEAALEVVNAGMDHADDCWMATPGPAECNCPMADVRRVLGLTPEKRLMSDEAKPLDLEAIEARMRVPARSAEEEEVREWGAALVAEVKRLRDRIGFAQAALEDCRRHHIDPRDHEEVIP